MPLIVVKGIVRKVSVMDMTGKNGSATMAMEPVTVDVGQASVPGYWVCPQAIRGVVVFAHGSGSSHRSRRNIAVAESLCERGIASLLFDLLTKQEAEIDAPTGTYRFDPEFLARRVVGATDWLSGKCGSHHAPIGYFGASTGAAAVLVAAARKRGEVRAVVSRGGRLELAEPAVPEVDAPTLLIVGEEDVPVLTLNRGAIADFNAEVVLEVVEGASHRFEEPGALDHVARLTDAWFDRHLGGP